MQTKINDYTSPAVYVVNYRSEGILCASPSTSPDTPGGDYNGDNDLGDI